MSDILSFSFESSEIRVIESTKEADTVWFVLRDVLNALGSSTRPSDAAARVTAELGEGVVSNYPLQTAGGIQDAILVHENAVAFLISTSRTEASKKLNRAIFLEILPAIRKQGHYALQPAPTLPASLTGLIGAKERFFEEMANLERHLEQARARQQQLIDSRERCVEDVRVLDAKLREAWTAFHTADQAATEQHQLVYRMETHARESVAQYKRVMTANLLDWAFEGTSQQAESSRPTSVHILPTPQEQLSAEQH